MNRSRSPSIGAVLRAAGSFGGTLARGFSGLIVEKSYEKCSRNNGGPKGRHHQPNENRNASVAAGHVGHVKTKFLKTLYGTYLNSRRTSFDNALLRRRERRSDDLNPSNRYSHGRGTGIGDQCRDLGCRFARLASCSRYLWLGHSTVAPRQQATKQDAFFPHVSARNLKPGKIGCGDRRRLHRFARRGRMSPDKHVGHFVARDAVRLARVTTRTEALGMASPVSRRRRRHRQSIERTTYLSVVRPTRVVCRGINVPALGRRPPR